MSELFDQHYLLTQQYNNAQKLEARIRLHQRFSTNPYDWHRWVFDHFTLSPQSRVLEIGCGPGDLWRKNADRIPAGWQVTLTDFSPGMLEEIQHNLRNVPHTFTFKQADAQALPFGDDSFDIVIANHMLYHVPDRMKALAEIARVLKPGGVFYAATNGRNHLREFRDVAALIAPSVETLWGKELSSSFRLENGAEQMAPWFSPIALYRYEDGLVVTEAQPLMAFILSTPVASLFDETMLRQGMERIQQKLHEEGAIRITKDTGLFVAHRRQ